jgi:1,4-alpha-glucan branching enzyme
MSDESNTMQETLSSLAEGRCPTPFDVLGVHALDSKRRRGMIVRVLITWADAVEVVRGDAVTPMHRVGQDGMFEVRFPDERDHFAYRLRVTDADGRQFVLDDPYRFLPVLDESRLAGFRSGVERHAYRVLGARVVVHQDVEGTLFSVWAPYAHNVNLMGELNRWDARCHPMRPLGESGVWELFVPGVGRGAHYKFEVRTKARDLRLDKADPFCRSMELRPNTASVVWDAPDYPWDDSAWMETRMTRHARESSLAIYEVHLGSWRRKPGADPGEGRPGWLDYRELAEELLPYVKDMGFTHVELLPVAEHPLDESWGYQTVGYFAPTARHGSPDDLRYFIDRAHALEIGVLIDWVPAHFPRDSHGLAWFDGTSLFEHHDPRRGAHPDWGTLVFDYGRPEVISFLLSNAMYWLEEFHVDGLRVDAVASMLYLDYSREEGEWLPNVHGGRENLEAVAFLRRLTDAIHEEVPGALMIAEESTAWPKVSHPTTEGGLGFDLKWNMGWMNDVLSVMSTDPLYRKGMYDKLTFGIWYAGSERFLLPLSHDEVVHMKGSLLGKMPGSIEQQRANLRLLFGFMWGYPGKKLLFMGGEFGQPSEWNHEGVLEWDVVSEPGHRGIQALVRELNRLYHDSRALRELDLDPTGFEWLDCNDAARTTLAFIRWAKDWKEPMLVVANFTPVEWKQYQLPVPFEGRYRVVLNTSAAAFTGDDPAHELPDFLTAVKGIRLGRPFYVEFDLPPLSTVFLEWMPPAG